VTSHSTGPPVKGAGAGEDTGARQVETKQRAAARRFDAADAIRPLDETSEARSAPTDVGRRTYTRSGIRRYLSSPQHRARVAAINRTLEGINPKVFDQKYGAEVTMALIGVLDRICTMPDPADLAEHWPEHLEYRLGLSLDGALEWLAGFHNAKNAGGAP
jgi:hypothetical protein